MNKNRNKRNENENENENEKIIQRSEKSKEQFTDSVGQN